MNRAGWIQSRRKRYLAKVLSDFERHVEPLLPDNPTAKKATDDFKAMARAKFNALAVDAIDIAELDAQGFSLNAVAQDTRDKLASQR